MSFIHCTVETELQQVAEFSLIKYVVKRNNRFGFSTGGRVSGDTFLSNICIGEPNHTSVITLCRAGLDYDLSFHSMLNVALTEVC